MNLKIIRHKMKQKIYYFQLLKNCKTLIKQPHTQSEETSEFEFTKSRETFLFKPHFYLMKDLK